MMRNRICLYDISDGSGLTNGDNTDPMDEGFCFMLIDDDDLPVF